MPGRNLQRSTPARREHLSTVSRNFSTSTTPSQPPAIILIILFIAKLKQPLPHPTLTNLHPPSPTPRKLLHHFTDHGGPDVVEGVEAVGGEDLDRGDAAQVAPVGAVVGGTDGGVAVGAVLGGGRLGPVGEREVCVAGEALVGEGGGGDDEDGAGPEAEEEGGARGGTKCGRGSGGGVWR
ncbi:uncharacterized protein A4U43_C07F29960 [Asparagus officinalis]|uniref:Uncharacterized protein n=1 Tax=Asparagus officinalis TaxID=4686 RepID=A0A5P1EJM5_ASPOF|nr:uncharacterized protein A4U43_C07F29960 [Asparagus officinalis]